VSYNFSNHAQPIVPPFPDSDDKLVLAEDCRRCPKLVESRECISWGNSPSMQNVMVVGEAPGRASQTSRSGKAATGPE